VPLLLLGRVTKRPSAPALLDLVSLGTPTGTIRARDCKASLTHAAGSGTRAMISSTMRRLSGCARRSACAIRRQALLASGGALRRPQPLAHRIVTAARQTRRERLQGEAVVPAAARQLPPREHALPHVA